MNYAWALEYVELTNGNGAEQQETMGMWNALGLHGNAIHSKCQLFDPLVVRDPFNEKQFSHGRFPVNAHGTEVRLGGRMGLFMRVASARNSRGDDAAEGGEDESQSQSSRQQQRHFIAGSVHKIDLHMHRVKLQAYFEDPAWASRIGIVTAGYEKKDFCASSGLDNAGNASMGTWPSNCEADSTTTGRSRGDNFCVKDFDVLGDETLLPCFQSNDEADSLIQMSDHAIINLSWCFNNIAKRLVIVCGLPRCPWHPRVSSDGRMKESSRRTILQYHKSIYKILDQSRVCNISLYRTMTVTNQRLD